MEITEKASYVDEDVKKSCKSIPLLLYLHFEDMSFLDRITDIV